MLEVQDRKKSLDFYFNNEINKSVASDISYEVPELSIVSKKGDEIKKRLESQKELLINSISKCVTKMSEILGEIEEKPNEYENTESTIKKFGYSQIYSKDGVGVGIESPNACKMREYNNCVWFLKEQSCELNKLNLIISNVKENKEYKLPLNIASQLGFWYDFKN